MFAFWGTVALSAIWFGLGTASVILGDLHSAWGPLAIGAFYGLFALVQVRRATK